MELKELDMHCGNCGIIDYCTSDEDTIYYPCIDNRIKNLTEEEYEKFACSLKYNNRRELQEKVAEIVSRGVYKNE